MCCPSRYYRSTPCVQCCLIDCSYCCPGSQCGGPWCVTTYPPRGNGCGGC